MKITTGNMFCNFDAPNYFQIDKQTALIEKERKNTNKSGLPKNQNISIMQRD